MYIYYKCIYIYIYIYYQQHGLTNKIIVFYISRNAVLLNNQDIEKLFLLASIFLLLTMIDI